MYYYVSNKGESWPGTNLGPLPSRSQIRTNPGLDESGTTAAAADFVDIEVPTYFTYRVVGVCAIQFRVV